jgi:tetratricopeptide (TPR) repeat protein
VRRALAAVCLVATMSACSPSFTQQTGSSASSALDLMFRNRYSTAAGQLQGLIKDHPHDARARAAYALLLNYESKQVAALDQVRQASDLAPDDAYVLTVLTRVQDWNRKVPEAVASGARAVRADSKSVLAHAFYGEALADQGRYDEAVAELQAATDLAAKSGSAYERAEAERNWANYYQDRKDYTQALVHFKQAANAQPDWAERLLELARFSLARQDFPAATGYLQRAADVSPDDPGLREQLGAVALFAQDYRVAKDAYTAALKLQPRSALDLKLLGDIAVALDRDFDTAVREERAALSAQQSDAEAGAFLTAVLRYLRSDEAGARTAATHSVAPGPNGQSGAAFLDLDAEALSRQSTALNEVNRFRALAGLQPVRTSAIIQHSALAHAFYTLFNGASPQVRDLGIHKESSGTPGFTGVNVLNRAEHAGYAAHSMAEVITHRQDATAAVTDWIDSVFHRIPLLRADMLELGYGDAYLGPLSIQVMDLSYRERTTGRIVLYPAPDQNDVPPAFFGNEIPDPLEKAGVNNAAYPVGYPITATFDRLSKVQVLSWHLRDIRGKELPGAVLKPDNPEMENSFAFMALSPLAEGATYSMELRGSINGVAFQRSWHFTTRSPEASGVTAAALNPAAPSYFTGLTSISR